MSHVRYLGAVILLASMLLSGSESHADGGKRRGWCGPAIPTGSNQLALSGRLTQRLVWGPPNFGENPRTDRRYAIWVLKLRYPIPVSTDSEFKKSAERKPRKPTALVSDLQLIPENVGSLDTLNAQSGRMTTVVGTLWTAEAPAEYTPVVMHITSVESASILSTSCDGRLVKAPI